MKIKLLFYLILNFPLMLWGQAHNIPPSFNHEGKSVVFADFQSGHYQIRFDPHVKKVFAKTTIHFNIGKSGFVAFDLKSRPQSIFLDDTEVSSLVISDPLKETWFRILSTEAKAGSHKLVINSQIEEGVLFLNNGVSSAFWFTDLGDRAFLEAYLPASFEYDQYKITFDIYFNNLINQKIYTNGTVIKHQSDHFTVSYPENYNSSALYFHTAPIGRFREMTFNFTSINKKSVPVLIYTAQREINLDLIKIEIKKKLESLEVNYGAFLHHSLTVFIAGNGGMEYCGALMSDIWTLSHEITHSYFGRGGLMPANGNAGWLDEAITMWIEEGSGSLSSFDKHSNMAGNSPYRRYTHPDAYSIGENFMKYLNFKFRDKYGLNAFLNDLIRKENFKPMTTESFIKKISHFYQEDLDFLFRKHVFSSKARENHYHPDFHRKMSLKEMRSLL